MDNSIMLPKKKKEIRIEIDNLIIKNSKCGIEETMKILCGKWNLELINYCIENNESVSHLRTIFTHIPRTTLSKKINQLCEIGLLKEIEEKLYTTNMAIELLIISNKIDKILNNDIYSELSLDKRFELLNKMIGQKWKSRILYLLLNFETVRFNEFTRILEGISHKILKEALEDMEAMQIVNRKAYNEKIPKVEYSLTQKGKKCAEFINEISNWSKIYGISTQKVTVIIE